MRILAIETSCDETAISLVEFSGDYIGHPMSDIIINVLAHEVISQIDMHREWGGVVPSIAKREHLKNLPILLNKILDADGGKFLNSKVKSQKSKVANLIAVTYGPGLEPALWQGINFAKELANKWGVPVVATDHMAGHVASALLRRSEISNSQFLISN